MRYQPTFLSVPVTVPMLLAAAIVAIVALGCAETKGPPDKLGQLQKTLASSKDDKIRVLTIDQIATFGQKARPALDDLVKAATASGDPRPRWHAARAIGLIGEDAISALPVIVEMLNDPDPIVATQAAAAIGLIRTDDDRAVEAISKDDAEMYQSAATALVGKMIHPDGRVRRASLRALKSLKVEPAVLVPMVNQQLANADPQMLMPALNTLADMGAAAVPFLMESLKNPKARYWATVALTEIGPAAAPAIALLTKAVAGEEAGEAGSEERMQAILALAAIGKPAAGPADPAATAELVKAMESSDESLRCAAAFALGRMRAKTADKALEKATGDSDLFLASIAAWARACIDPTNKSLVEKAVAALQANLKSEKPNVRSGSISALSDLTDELGPAGEALLADQFVGLLSDLDPGVQSSAGAALVRLGAGSVAALQKSLADPQVRMHAMEVLAAIGPLAKPAMAAMIQSLSDSDPAFQGDAMMAIAAMGADADAAVPELEKIIAVEGGEPGLLYSAAYALGRIGPASKPAAARLLQLTQSKDEMLATVAVWAALKIEPQDQSLIATAVPLLRRALRGDQELVRLEAAVALGDIGPAAGTAIPLLELVSEDDSVKAVRSAAAEALKKTRVQ